MTKTHSVGNNAFTLVEVSIVMVIIGLILGGILVGRDLILAAERRATIAQIDEINTAVTTYKLKFGCIPGDCTTTTGGYPQAGNGNGILQDWGWEVSRFFPALWAAGMLPKINSGNSAVQDTKLSGGFRKSIWFVYNSSQSNITPKDTKHRLWLAAPNFIGSFMVFDGVAALHPRDAYWFDAKIDDGYPLLGNVRAASDYYDSAAPAVVPTLAYADPNPENCVLEVTTDVYEPYNIRGPGETGEGNCSLIFPSAF